MEAVQTDLQDRARSIGASDSAGILMVSSWSSPQSVYADKRGLSDPFDAEHLKWGRLLEPIILQQAAERLGCQVRKPAKAIRNPNIPYFHANLDGVFYGNAEHEGIPCEAKVTSTSEGFGPDGTDHVPAQYQIQCQHQMMVTEDDRCVLAALIRGTDLRLYYLQRNEEIIAKIREAGTHFWEQHVIRQEMPGVDWSHSPSVAAIAKLTKVIPGTLLEVQSYDDPLYMAAQDYNVVNQYKLMIEKIQKAAKARMMYYTKGAQKVIFPDGSTLSTTVSKRKGYVVAPTEVTRSTLKWANVYTPTFNLELSESGRQLFAIEPPSSEEGEGE